MAYLFWHPRNTLKLRELQLQEPYRQFWAAVNVTRRTVDLTMIKDMELLPADQPLATLINHHIRIAKEIDQ